MNHWNPIFLKLAIIAPLLASIVLFFSAKLSRRLVQTIAALGFVIPAVISVILCLNFAGEPKGVEGYVYFSDMNTGLQQFGIRLALGLNGVSMPLFLLAGLVGAAAGIYALYANIKSLNYYLAFLLMMQAGLMGTFASVDIFFFYFFHELALIPTFIMIGVWGGVGRRSAAMELTIYLTLGAMLSLIGLIALYFTSEVSTFDMISMRGYLTDNPISDVVSKNIFGLLMIGFGILVSLFPFHSWAPRGYAAAPTSAAMLHAGVLKKFGLYGLIQIAAPLLPAGAEHWVYLMAILALGNIIFIGLVTMAQRDLRQMISYSSVMHMGYAFLGIACLSTLGLSAALMLMVAHGLSVALLFLLSTVIHHRTETFEMAEIGGLCQKTPVLCGFFVAAIMANIGLPGFANFWGELGVFLGLWQFQPWMVFAAVSGIIISAIYGLRAVANIFFGEPTEAFKERFASSEIKDIRLFEKIPALILLIALLFVGFYPKLISEPINDNLSGNYHAIPYALIHSE